MLQKEQMQRPRVRKGLNILWGLQRGQWLEQREEEEVWRSAQEASSYGAL